MSRVNMLVFIFFALACVSDLSYAADLDFPKSKVLLEQRAQELKEESRLKGSLKNDLSKLDSDVKQAQLCLDGKSLVDPSTAASTVANLEKAWRAVVNAGPKTILDVRNAEFDALSRSVSAIQSLASAGFDCLNDLPVNSRNTSIQLLDAGVGGFSSTRAGQSSAISDLVNRQLLPVIRDNRRKGFSGLQSFIFDYQGEDRTRDTLTESQISELEGEISSASQISEIQKQTVTQLKDALKQLSSSVQNELSATNNRLADIDKILSQLDDKLSTGSAATDKQLIVAVYMMIVALIVLFLGMKFIDAPLAAKIIENRSLVEVISMAFLLLTIIILGTGEKMPKDAIGTLLGSIAGYIFGRKMSEGK